jgi:hypothetical protein
LQNQEDPRDSAKYKVLQIIAYVIMFSDLILLFFFSLIYIMSVGSVVGDWI